MYVYGVHSLDIYADRDLNAIIYYIIIHIILNSNFIKAFLKEATVPKIYFPQMSQMTLYLGHHQISSNRNSHMWLSNFVSERLVALGWDSVGEVGQIL